MPALRTAYTAARGAMIGVAEILPGISGGTIALITGVYETVITSAGHFLSGAKALFSDRERAREEFARVKWGVIIPLLAGMIPALLLAARFIAPLVDDHPTPMFALFLGMTATAIIVPISMKRSQWTPREIVLAAVVAVGVFFLVGLPPQELTPSLPVVFVAAAVAVCALVLPGTSGSFILLTVGLYQPTLQALNDRDLGYIATFITGMIVGLAAFVKTLQWLLEHRRDITLVILTGVVAGALRALWPWQTDDRVLLAPSDQVGLSMVMFGIGVAVVLGLFIAGRRVDAAVPTSQH